jgi:hypothetical protein
VLPLCRPKANHQSLSIKVLCEETTVKVWLLIALFVGAAPVAVKAEIMDRGSPLGDQSRVAYHVAYHRELAAVSPPTAVAAVRSAGLSPATLPVKIGATYVMRAVDKRGTKVRVVLAANTGEILAIHSAATKQDDVSKPLGNSRAKPILASSSTTTERPSSLARRWSSTPVSSPPMQILPKIAASLHKTASAAHTVSLAVAPLMKVAANEPVEPRIPAALLGTLHSVGLTPATAPVKVEPTYVVQAINQRGMTLRVLLAANSGDILAIQLTRGAPRRDHRDGETSGLTDSARPGTLATPPEAHLVAASSAETPFIAP